MKNVSQSCTKKKHNCNVISVGYSDVSLKVLS